MFHLPFFLNHSLCSRFLHASDSKECGPHFGLVSGGDVTYYLNETLHVKHWFEYKVSSDQIMMTSSLFEIVSMVWGDHTNHYGGSG